MDLTPRQIRAHEIADKFRIIKNDGKWLVPSQTGPGKYSVQLTHSSSNCSCPDYELRQEDCKHVMAVRLTIEREQNPDGTTTVTEVFEAVKRTTYPQNWPAYNLAQTTEQDHFQVLLRDLCAGIEEPVQTKGRPRLPLSDVVFAAAFKVYSTFSGRRFMSDLREAKERGWCDSAPNYNSIFRYLANPALTPILKDLIVQSSLPLKSIEVDFAADSSGFSTCRYERWFDHKWGKERLRHEWVKVHIMTGVRTNIIVAVEIKGKDSADAPQLPGLLETTMENFSVAEVSGDKGYLSYRNARVVADAGATPFIAFKKNSHPGDYRKVGVAKSAAWSSMYHYFNFRREEFLQHYHKRSNVESTFSMIKRKFGDSLRSKTDTAMVNEALCKILCHNLVVVIHEVHELGISPQFVKPHNSPSEVGRD